MGTTWRTTLMVWCVAVSFVLAGSVSTCAAELPDSPGATVSQAEPAVAQQSNLTAEETSETTLAQATTPPPNPQQQSSESSSSSQSRSSQSSTSGQAGEAQPSGQKPVGTAAAGSVPATGVAASQPAGNAIAPGKQRRVRSIVLKTGAIIAAGVAVGSVAALTLGTSSKPPGAH
jgi:hypothetical protein